MAGPAHPNAPTIDNHRGLVAYFARNPVASNLVMVILLVGGLLAALGLTAQVFPTIDPGTVTISVAYPGATPSEVEEGITRRVEEAVFGIDGVDRVISRASENLGSVTLELKDFVDADKVRDDAEAAVQQLIDFPPEDAEQAKIVRAETLADVLTIVVSSEMGERELRRGAEAIEEELLALPGVSLVTLVGAKDYEIAIEITEASLRRYDLTMSEVANTIRQSSINLSSGEIRTRGGDLLLRTNTKGTTGKSFENIVLRASSDGSVLRVSDVATVRDGFIDVDLINQFNGRESIFVKVQKSEAEDVLAIAEEIKIFLTDYTPPQGVDVSVWDDQTEILQDRVGLLLRNGLLGFALVFLFLVIMLDLRLALWVAMGVPISFLGAFLFFDAFDVNINMISLFALIIVLGIVVDDAVVVGENIIAEQEQGKRGMEAAMDGVKGVFGPVMVGVLTTMAAFAPLLFVTGTFGQILGSVPVVVILVLGMSLIEAFLILPSHLANGGKWSRWPLDRIQDAVAGVVERFRNNILAPAVAKAVRHRYLTLLGGIGLLVLAGSLVTSGAVRFIFFPDLESSSIRATVEFPVGTPFNSTKSAADRLVAAANAVNEKLDGVAFESISVTIGGQTRTGGGPGGGGGLTVASHLASVQIELGPEPPRTQSAKELERLWRNEVGEIAGVERLSYVADFFSGGADVEFELAHQDGNILEQAVATLKTNYATLDGFYEIQDSNSIGKRQFDINLTPTGEAAGLTPADVARQLRRNFFGEEVQRIQRGREELKVMVRYPEASRQSTADLFGARIRLADGTEAPLSSVAQVTESRSYSAINRVDGLRIVSVSAQVDNAVTTPSAANTAVTNQFVPLLKQQFPGLQIRQAGQGREQSEDLGALGRLTLVALLIIFALMASQLKSYTQPIIILAGVPFGAAGALVGHYLLGYNLSFISIFGMVALSGVVVNDSLVLVDRYNKLVEEGWDNAEAIIEASRRRFRAIFLTTATTALGLTPMLFETSTQAQFLIPMAVSLATGIVFASVIILFLIPALVMIREDMRMKGKGASSDELVLPNSVN
ncbi:MAG: efflux RND transporter permease subunit [Pseudomonadales bacterium]|jgi:multidrug efflux pump subunit AcrB|tara:strand:- start:179 stop:3358 length:3180 start_codon:yes stop_codon:yes gene_type:complete